MIERVTAYKSSDGKTFEKIEDVQRHELTLLAAGEGQTRTEDDEMISWIVANRDKVIDILTTTSRSKPKARSINGGKKSRKPAGHPTHVQIQTNPPTTEKLP